MTGSKRLGKVRETKAHRMHTKHWKKWSLHSMPHSNFSENLSEHRKGTLNDRRIRVFITLNNFRSCKDQQPKLQEVKLLLWQTLHYRIQ